MAQFRLLAGRHIHKGRTYLQGEVVNSNIDLVARLGAGKFARIGGELPEHPELQPVQSSAAPGGQVSSGHQATTSLLDGTQISGPEDKILAGRDALRNPEDQIGVLPAGDTPATTQPGRHPEPKHPEAKKALPANLDQMSMNQLREYAHEEEIDLAGHTTRADMVKHIKSTRKA